MVFLYSLLKLIVKLLLNQIAISASPSYQDCDSLLLMDRRISRIDKYPNSSLHQVPPRSSEKRMQPISGMSVLQTPTSMLYPSNNQTYSPSSRHLHANTYSTSSNFEQLREWCERVVDSWAKPLKREISQNQETIKILSQKIVYLQKELERKERTISQLSSRIATSKPSLGVSKGDMIEITNKLLNDKLKERWNDVNAAIQGLESVRQELRSASQGHIENYQFKMQERINRNVFDMKTIVKDKLEEIKQTNSNYWNKIKSWTKLFEERLATCDANTSILAKQGGDLQDSIQNSLMGIYKLKNFATRFKEIDEAIYDLEEAFKVVIETQLDFKDALDNANQSQNLVDLSYSKDQFQIAEERRNIPQKRYSPVQFPTYSPLQQQNDLSAFRPPSSKNGSTGSYSFAKTDNQPVTAMQIRKSESPRKQASTKLSPLNQDFSLLSSVNSNADLEPSRATFQSFKSSTSQSRREMMVDVRKRLLEVIEEKKIGMPMACFLDEINYLKNSYNNYIFDLKGHMFKMKKEEFEQLCAENILKKL